MLIYNVKLLTPEAMVDNLSRQVPTKTGSGAHYKDRVCYSRVAYVLK